jgi:ferredoxin-NADP reductase
MVLTLVSKEHLIDNIWAFRLQASEPLAWTAGQFVRVELPHDNADGEGTKRWFTNSAAPYEGILQITTRITDSTFKQALAKLEPGSTALQLLDPPSGDFIWQETALPIVFIAGGIGITPFYSILKQRVHDGQTLDITLIYASRTADVPFRTEFDQWAAANPGFTVAYLPGVPLKAEQLIQSYPALRTSLVYISGPEPIVEDLGDDLIAHGVPQANIKQDFFPNYTELNF